VAWRKDKLYLPSVDLQASQAVEEGSIPKGCEGRGGTTVAVICMGRHDGLMRGVPTPEAAQAAEGRAA